MRKLLQARVIFPLILSVSLLGALLTFADVHAVVAAIRRFQPVYLLGFLACMAVYEAVRCAQWRVMLNALDIRVPLRTCAFTFLTGEMAKTLPFGQYLRNYLLRQSGGANIGRSAPATLAALLIEDVVSLGGVFVLGLGGWPWLRPLIVVSACAFALLLWLAYRLVLSAHAPRWLAGKRQLRALLGELRMFRESTALLLANPRALLVQGGLGALYLVLGAAALYTLVLGLGVGGVSFSQVLAVYFFSLAVGLLLPIPVDVGLIEMSGTTALLAVGMTKSAAVAAMLLNRVLGGAAAVLIALVTMAVLQGELRAALGPALRRRRKPATAAAAVRAERATHQPAAHEQPSLDEPVVARRRVPSRQLY